MERKTYSEQRSETDRIKESAEFAHRDLELRRKDSNEQFDDMFRDVDYREWQVAAWREYNRSLRKKVVAEKDCVTAQAPSGLNSVVVGASPQALVEANRALNQAIAFLGNLDAVGQPFGVRDSAMSARRLCLDAIGFVEALHKELTRGK